MKNLTVEEQAVRNLRSEILLLAQDDSCSLFEVYITTEEKDMADTVEPTCCGLSRATGGLGRDHRGQVVLHEAGGAAVLGRVAGPARVHRPGPVAGVGLRINPQAES
jgi:hypothetical protein